MSLSYNILWVDDQKDEFSNIQNNLKMYIEELFFTPNIIFCEDLEEAKAELKKNSKFDVIFSDYNINEETGYDFIKYLRDEKIFTEVLFYSGQNELPQERLDRVTFFFSSGKSWHNKLEDKMKDLISLTVDKLEDLTNLRGLVMTEVSALDSKMEEILLKYFTQTKPENKEERITLFRDTIINLLESDLKKNIDNCENKICSHIWRNNTDIKSIITNPEFGSFYKAKGIEAIISKLKSNTKAKRFIQSFKRNIITERNKLAHSISTIERGTEILKTKKGDYIYDKEKITSIRKHIKRFDEYFDSLSEEIDKINI